MDPMRTHAPLRRTSGQLQNLRVATINDFDSCYSSCDDISHASLSRESSDSSRNNEPTSSGSGSGSRPIMANNIYYPNYNYNLSQSPNQFAAGGKASEELADYAIKLGFSMDQMRYALNQTGELGHEDRMLAELLKTGKGNSEHVQKPRMQPKTSTNPADLLRTIVIDGSNVAMAHGRKEVFSCAGIRDCVNFFLDRGHRDIYVFIPQYRREQPRADSPITDQHILDELEPFIKYTPSRNINGRRVVCHDDLYILRTAQDKDAVIVSNDEYRDLTKKNPTWRTLVEQRQLMFTIVDDKFVPPDDPMGRYGPRLDQFLSKAQVLPSAQICPYARKCTYGNKCKYYHPERINGAPSVTDRLMKENQQKKSLSAVKSMQYEMFKNKHCSLSRTQSLNMVQPGEIAPNHQQIPGQYSSPHQPIQHVNSAPWQQQNQQYLQPPPIHHNNSNSNSRQSVSRNSSMPLSPVNRGPFESPNSSQTHLYAPSTAIWGNSELSVGPLSTRHNLPDHLINADPRSRVQYHLSNIFPEHVVEAVMTANPGESNPQIICEKILNMGRGFKLGQ